MAMVDVNITMDSELKEAFEALCADAGLTISDAFTLFAERAVWRDSIPNRETLEALAEVEEMKANPALGKSYTDVDEMLEDILAEGV